MMKAIEKVERKHPNAKIIFEQTFVANPFNLYTRFKESDLLMDHNRNYCMPTVSEGEMLDKLNELFKIEGAELYYDVHPFNK